MQYCSNTKPCCKINKKRLLPQNPGVSASHSFRHTTSALWTDRRQFSFRKLGNAAFLHMQYPHKGKRTRKVKLAGQNCRINKTRFPLLLLPPYSRGLSSCRTVKNKLLSHARQRALRWKKLYSTWDFERKARWSLVNIALNQEAARPSVDFQESLYD